MRPELDRLPALIALIDTRLAALTRPGHDAEAWRAFQASVDAIGGELETFEGARLDRRADGTRLTLAGIGAHSTTGLTGALRNWQVAARRRLEMAGRA